MLKENQHYITYNTKKLALMTFKNITVEPFV